MRTPGEARPPALLEDRAVLGRDYWIGEKIAAEVVASGVEYVRGATVTDLAPHFELAFTAGGAAARVRDG